MNNLWKSLFFLLAGVLFFSGVAFAQDELEVNEAINLALENSIDLRISKIDLDNSRINYKRNEADIMRTGSRYAELQNELGLLQAENSFTQRENQLVRDTARMFFQIILSEMELERKEVTMELEKRRLDEVERQVQTGHRSQLDLIQQQGNYNSAAFDLEASRQDLIQDREEFKYKLGLEELPPLDSGALGQINPRTIDLEEFLEEAIAASIEITVREKQFELAEIDLNRAKEVTTPTLDLQQKENDLEVARLNIIKTERDIQHRFQQMYNSFVRSRNTLQLAVESLEEAEKNHAIIIRQEELGLRTTNDLLSSRISLMGAQQSLASSVNSYYLILLEIFEAMGRNLKEVADEILQN